MTAVLHTWYGARRLTLTMVRSLSDGPILVSTYQREDGSYVVRARVTGTCEASGWAPALVREISVATEPEAIAAVTTLHAEALERAAGLRIPVPPDRLPAPRGPLS